MNVLFGLNKLELDNKKILLIAIACVFVLYIDYSFIMGMQRNGIKSIKTQKEKINKDITELNKNLVDLEILKKKQGDAPVKQKKLITEEQLTALLEDISLAANTNNVKIMQIKAEKELKAKDVKPAVSAVKAKPLYIILDVSGSYHDIGRFINNLENAEKFMSVLEIKITRDSSDYMKENVNLLLKTYAKK